MEKCLMNWLEMQELKDIFSWVLLMLMKKYNPSVHDDGSSGVGYPIKSNSTTEVLVLLSATINFIGCWMKWPEHNLLQRCNM